MPKMKHNDEIMEGMTVYCAIFGPLHLDNGSSSLGGRLKTVGGNRCGGIVLCTMNSSLSSGRCGGLSSCCSANPDLNHVSNQDMADV